MNRSALYHNVHPPAKIVTVRGEETFPQRGSDPPSVRLDLAALPPPVRDALTPAADVALAERFTHDLAHSHYENFSVVTFLVPRKVRQDFCNIYAFCRTADDLGDELGNRELSLDWLTRLKRLTRECFDGKADVALFQALSASIRRHDLQPGPFLDLIDAFEQDQRVTRYATFDQVVDYCRRSANPVGRLVLHVAGYRDEQRAALSDKTCTALQLANFWQDVRRDIVERDRIYIPRDSMARFGVDEAQIREFRCDDHFRGLMRFEVDRTQKLFDEGEALLPMLKGWARGQVSLFGQGGQLVLQSIRRQNYNTLTRRPRLSKWQKVRLIMGAVMARLGRAMIGGGR